MQRVSLHRKDGNSLADELDRSRRVQRPMKMTVVQRGQMGSHWHSQAIPYMAMSSNLSLSPGLYTPDVWISFRKRLIEINPKDAAEKVK